MTDAEQPLLGGGSDDAGGYDAADVARRLEEGLSQDDTIDFEDLLRSKPDYVVSYLAEKGTRKLGTFTTDDTEVLPLMEDGAIWTLGADRIDIDFERVWKHRLATDNIKAKGFSSKVEVEAHVVTLKNAALPNDRGVLNPLLEKWQDGALSTRVFGLPAVQAVIQHKWSTWARRVLLWEFLFYLVWLLSFQVFIILFQDEDLNLSFKELWQTPRGGATVIAAVTSLVGMAPFVYIELCTVKEYGPRRWLSVWNSIDILTYIFQILISVAYFGRWHLKSDALSILSALQVLFLWWRVQYFARAFQQMKNSFVNTIVAVVRDVRWFLLLLLITLWGFAGAYYILFRDEQGTTKFDNPWHALSSMFTIMLGDVDIDLMYNSKKPVIGVILLIVFLFVMTMVLLNLLIAIMSDAAARASDGDGTKFLCSKAELIDELEASLPGWLRRDSWYPPFIHILKVNPTSREKVASSQLWANAAQESKEDDPDSTKEAIADMRVEIGELKSLLQQALQNHTEDGRGLIGGTIETARGMLPHVPIINPGTKK